LYVDPKWGLGRADGCALSPGVPCGIFLGSRGSVTVLVDFKIDCRGRRIVALWTRLVSDFQHAFLAWIGGQIVAD
jgi:hypothetical protein